MTQLAHDHEILTTPVSFRRPIAGRLGTLLAVGLLVFAGALSGSLPARADEGANGGSDGRDEYGSDHDGVYQAQRGDIVCESRQACGGADAVPMNQPGYYYLPGGSGRAATAGRR
jgi:hypothetical protein